MKIAVKEVGKELRIEERDIRYRGELFEDVVKDAYLEEVILFNDEAENSYLSLLVDEDGLPKELDTNFYIRMNNPFFPLQRIVGTAVICRIKKIEGNPYEENIKDFEVTDLLDKDIELLNTFLGEKVQSELKRLYGNNPNDFPNPFVFFTK